MDQAKKSMRHEIKYRINNAQAEILRQRLKAVLRKDEFMNGQPDYFVRSVYLDDICDSSYYDKLAGIPDRKKYRIRIYNYDPDVIKLECKEKLGSRIHKESVRVSREDCRKIINGDYECLGDRKETLCQKVYLLAHSKGLHNSVIVDYDREVFVHPLSNVRITFDKNLHAGGFESFSIFQEDLLTFAVYPYQSVILEVKYDEVLPAYVGSILSSTNLGAAVSASKYCMCKELMGKVKGRLQ